MLKKILMSMAFSLSAYAQQPRGEVGSGMDADALGVMFLLFLGASYLHIKAEFKKSHGSGVLAIAICSAIGLGAIYFEPIRMLFAVVTLFVVVAYAWKFMK